MYNSIVSTNQVIGDYLDGFKDGGKTCEKEIQQSKLDELDDLRGDLENNQELER